MKDVRIDETTTDSEGRVHVRFAYGDEGKLGAAKTVHVFGSQKELDDMIAAEADSSAQRLILRALADRK